MTSKFIIALTLAIAIVTGSAAVAPKAEAGVRLGFGFPLGVLVARSMMSQKHSGEKSYRKGYYAAKKSHSKKKAYAESYSSQSSAKRSAAAVQARSKSKYNKVAPAATAVAATTKPSDEARGDGNEASVAEEETADEATESSEATEETADNGECKRFFPTIGKTLTVPCEKGTKSASKTDEKSDDTAEKKSEKTAATEKKEGSATTTSSTKSSSKTAAKSTDCKKFFPNVGMTVSVPCTE